MSHQLCQNCGSNQFEQIDGRLYCVVCQSQNISLQTHVSFANEGNAQLGRRVGDQVSSSILDETVPKIEIIDSIDRRARVTPADAQERLSHDSDQPVINDEPSGFEGHVWSAAEVYSYILHLQTEAMIRLIGLKQEKANEFLECTYCLYLRYLSANGLVDTKEKRMLERQEERRQKINVFAKQLYTERQDPSKRPHAYIWNKDICPLNLDTLLGLIHCASLLIRRPISLRQMIRWINTHQLPYYNIQTFLPTWMCSNARERFHLEKMKIHSENFFTLYQAELRPIVKPYLSRCIFQSSAHFIDLLHRLCESFCQQIYFPYDDHTRPLFRSLCERIVQIKSNHRHFLSTSLDLEMIALILVFIIMVLRSIPDPLLDQFLRHHFQQRLPLFSYSIWLKNLNALIYLESIADYQFYGRTSVLLQSFTDSQSKIRYMSSLSKIFDRRLQSNYDEHWKEIEEEMQRVRQTLITNGQSGSLLYAMKTEEFFRREFPHLASYSRSSLFETVVHSYSPSSFSLVDKSELYETCLALVDGVTITQIEHFYLLHQRFDLASTSNFPLHHLLWTLTNFSSIPYNEEFHSFLSRFLKIFCLHYRLDHYFYQSTASRRTELSEGIHPTGRKQYGIDLLPVAYDLKLEQERPPVADPIPQPQ